MDEREGIVLTPEQQRRRRSRNVGIAMMLVAWVVIFYVVTLVKFGH